MSLQVTRSIVSDESLDELMKRARWHLWARAKQTVLATYDISPATARYHNVAFIIVPRRSEGILLSLSHLLR